jgi:chondroitin synthase
MRVINKAILAYENQKYAEALELFEEASRIYGRNLVEVNIQKCLKKLNLDIKHTQTQDWKLDPATRYMLALSGDLQLTEKEKIKCLEEYKILTSRKSKDAKIKPVKPIPPDWPKDLVLAPLPDSTNDFQWHLNRKSLKQRLINEPLPGLSIIIPTFNRSKILEVTLACLANQDTQYPFEVVVAEIGRAHV